MNLRYEVTKEGVRAAEAAARQVTTQLQYTNITSPVSGIVVNKIKQAGDMTRPGEPILIIENPRRIVLETYVKESYINLIAIGDRVQVLVDALNKEIIGEVAQVVRSGSSGTYRYLVKVSLVGSQELRAGMFARSNFKAGEKAGITIPVEAVVKRADLTGVYLIDPAGIAHYRMIRTGREWAESIEVVAGLKAGNRIALSSKSPIHTGLHVIDYSESKSQKDR